MSDSLSNDMSSIPEALDYQTFDTEWYFKNYMTGTAACENMKEDLEFFHRIFNQLDYIRGGNLLDIGTGPTVHNVLSASKHVENIYLSDFSENNLKFLKRWRNGEKDTPREILEFVSNLEGDKTPASDIDKRVRNKVRGILHADIRKSRPLGSWNLVPKFDIVTSSYCFGSVAETPQEYARNVLNVSSLLKKGGHMVLAGELGGTFYRVGNVKYSCVDITREEVVESIQKAGFEVICIELSNATEEDLKHYQIKSCYLLTAKKL